MECPKCQYQMSPFEKDCPKCARIEKNPPAPIVVPAASPLRDDKPAPTSTVSRVGLVMGSLFVVVLLALMGYMSYLHRGDAKAKADLEASQAQIAAERAKARADKATH